jgi:RNA polymerase sigma-70 factor (ECF subfamily)
MPTALNQLLVRVRAGDATALNELFEQTRRRFAALASRMFQDDRLGRWVELDDLIQNAALRLLPVLKANAPVDESAFFRLAATFLRRELIDLARHYFGPEGLGANYVSAAGRALESDGTPPILEPAAPSVSDPSHLTAWAEFHEAVGQLPDDQRILFDLLWYGDLTQEEAAKVLGLSSATLRRRWRDTRLRLHDRYGGRLPF